MNINFNNVRKQLVFRYDDLVEKLNGSIIKDDDQWARPNDASWDVNIKGYVLIDSEDLNEVLNHIRMLIGTIAMTYDEDSSEFANVYEEIFPEDSNKRMAIFNPEDEEE